MIKFLVRQSEFYLTFLILVMAAVIASINPAFLSAENIFSVLKSYSVFGIMAVGTLFVLILGGTPDISFCAIAQVSEYVVVLVTLKFGGNIVIALLIAAALGALLGSINGVVIQFFKVPTIIVTIATYNIFFGMLYVLTKGELINVVHPMFRQFSEFALFPAKNAQGAIYGLSLIPLMWLATLILGSFILNRTKLGRAIFAIGGNEVAAQRIGISTFKTRVFVFSFVGLLSGVAAIAHVSIVQSAIPNIIVGHEMEVIAAVVLGGASVFGGKGRVVGTFLGVLLFALLNNGLTLLKISPYWYSVAIGFFITLSISINGYQEIRQRKTRVNVKIEPAAEAAT